MDNSCFETIKIEDGKIFNLDWHNRRFHKTQKELFNTSSRVNLKDFISAPSIGLYRCKIIYDSKIQSVEYFPYQKKEFKRFQVVKSQIEYAYKYTNRLPIQSLLANYEEIIIEKDGLLTDTTIANIAFFDGKTWFTPTTPLLQGTTRARLIDEGFLKLRDIKKEDIKEYSHFALMNAMIGFCIQNVQIQ